MRPIRQHLSTYVSIAAIVALLFGPRLALAAATLSASSATASAPGGSAQICVSLNTNGEEVAGTQNDIVWDGACATLPDESACFAAGSHGKQLQGKILDHRDFTYRALILSLSDVDPIDSGSLYCCSFVAEANPGECCDIGISGAGASDSRGIAVPANGTGGELCVASASGAATRTPSPTATPTIEMIFDHGPSGDGCQTAAPSSASRGWWLVIGVVAILLRRHRGRPTRHD
jgi:MYXO-CTERM domain-containing protein